MIDLSDIDITDIPALAKSITFWFLIKNIYIRIHTYLDYFPYLTPIYPNLVKVSFPYKEMGIKTKLLTDDALLVPIP